MTRTSSQCRNGPLTQLSRIALSGSRRCRPPVVRIDPRSCFEQRLGDSLRLNSVSVMSASATLRSTAARFRDIRRLLHRPGCTPRLVRIGSRERARFLSVPEDAHLSRLVTSPSRRREVPLLERAHDSLSLPRFATIASLLLLGQHDLVRRHRFRAPARVTDPCGFPCPRGLHFRMT